MIDRIKLAFDCIHAEEELKAKTILFLQEKMSGERKPPATIMVKRFAVGFAFLLCILSAGLFSYSIYFTESAHIDFDINPSVGLTVNRFDRIIESHGYNADGENLLAGLNIKHKNYKDALDILIDSSTQQGFLQDNELVSVTFQTNDTTRESGMLSVISSSVETSVHEHHEDTQIEVFPVDSDVRNHAHELNVTPAKYLAILELREVNPTATVEGCREHTIGEIKSITQAYEAGHHHDTINSSADNNADAESESFVSSHTHHEGHGEHE